MARGTGSQRHKGWDRTAGGGGQGQRGRSRGAGAGGQGQEGDCMSAAPSQSGSQLYNPFHIHSPIIAPPAPMQLPWLSWRWRRRQQGRQARVLGQDALYEAIFAPMEGWESMGIKQFDPSRLPMGRKHTCQSHKGDHRESLTIRTHLCLKSQKIKMLFNERTGSAQHDDR